MKLVFEYLFCFSYELVVHERINIRRFDGVLSVRDCWCWEKYVCF